MASEKTSERTSGKVVANAKQTAGKTLANENFATNEASQPVDFVENSENFQNAPDIDPEDICNLVIFTSKALVKISNISFSPLLKNKKSIEKKTSDDELSS